LCEALFYLWVGEITTPLEENDQMRKICILAVTVILPALALAQTQYPTVSSTSVRPRPVPEANAALALVPIVGAILLLSWRQLTATGHHGSQVRRKRAAATRQDQT
jgi:hypothetical protein